MKADRTVIQQVLTAYEAGRDVDLRSILKHELMPVPVSLAEMDGTLKQETSQYWLTVQQTESHVLRK